MQFEVLYMYMILECNYEPISSIYEHVRKGENKRNYL